MFRRTRASAKCRCWDLYNQILIAAGINPVRCWSLLESVQSDLGRCRDRYSQILVIARIYLIRCWSLLESIQSEFGHCSDLYSQILIVFGTIQSDGGR